MSEQRVVLLRKGFIGSGALVALVMLAAFYSVVSGAVDRAARQRAAASDLPSRTAMAIAERPSARAATLFARSGN